MSLDRLPAKNNEHTMKHMKLITSLVVLLALMNNSVLAQNAKPTKILINNVEIFNGKNAKTTKGNVLIENNIITKISSSAIPTNRSGATPIIDGKGKFLMPGLIDAHVHIVDGNPIQNIKLIEDPATNFLLIMKDGVIHKNTLGK